MTVEEQPRPAWFELLAGGASGGIAKTATAPMQRVVILQQLRRVEGKKVAEVLRGVVSREGVSSLWAGNLVTVVHRFPYSGLSFMLYESVKAGLRSVRSRTGQKQPAPDAALYTTSERMLAGCIAGGGAVTLTYPLDTIRTHLTGNTRRSSILRVVAEIARTQGPAGFYRGLSVSVVQKIPEVALQMCVYESVKERLLSRVGLSKTAAVLLAAAAAGVTSLLTYPFDVVRRQLQVDTRDVYQKSTARCVAQLTAAHGVSALWAGARAELCRTLPFVVVMWASLESIRECYHHAAKGA
ncbi:putative mitochondrial carrier [Diplonema papillatum]|nr:putative mitochondrial carrier [Diplonema papillatum]